MSEWYNIVKKSHNPKVIIMLSGGKDSIATLISLVKKEISVTAIHFIHQWGELIPTEEAERICQEYDVELIKIDFSSRFYEAIKGYTDGRPCLMCKKQMYLCLEEYLERNQFGWLAIGDNANDTTTIARMKKYSNPFDDNMICSDYFGSEMGTKLPEGMHVLRPLIYMSANEVEQMLYDEGINVKRVNSTGDKYFEYHREGCPIQFIDNGFPIDVDILHKLREYNSKITEFARKRGIRASIHMPSTFIITIPEGYELEAAEYLEREGLTVNYGVNGSELKKTNRITALVKLEGTDIVKYQTYRKLFNRLLERLCINDCIVNQFDYENVVFCRGYKGETKIVMFIDKMDMLISLEIIYLLNEYTRIDVTYVKNLLIEIFRTRNIIIQ